MQNFFYRHIEYSCQVNRLSHRVRATVAVGLLLYATYIDYNHFDNTLINFVNSIAF